MEHSVDEAICLSGYNTKIDAGVFTFDEKKLFNKQTGVFDDDDLEFKRQLCSLAPVERVRRSCVLLTRNRKLSSGKNFSMNSTGFMTYVDVACVRSGKVTKSFVLVANRHAIFGGRWATDMTLSMSTLNVSYFAVDPSCSQPCSDNPQQADLVVSVDQLRRPGAVVVLDSDPHHIDLCAIVFSRLDMGVRTLPKFFYYLDVPLPSKPSLSGHTHMFPSAQETHLQRKIQPLGNVNLTGFALPDKSTYRVSECFPQLCTSRQHKLAVQFDSQLTEKEYEGLSLVPTPPPPGLLGNFTYASGGSGSPVWCESTISRSILNRETLTHRNLSIVTPCILGVYFAQGTNKGGWPQPPNTSLEEQQPTSTSLPSRAHPRQANVPSPHHLYTDPMATEPEQSRKRSYSQTQSHSPTFITKAERADMDREMELSQQGSANDDDDEESQQGSVNDDDDKKSQQGSANDGEETVRLQQLESRLKNLENSLEQLEDALEQLESPKLIECGPLPIERRLKQLENRVAQLKEAQLNIIGSFGVFVPVYYLIKLLASL